MRWLCVLVLCGCIPDLEDRASLVTGPRVLAISATPAESSAGAMVTFDTLAVVPGSDSAGLVAQLDWAFCNDPVPLDQIEPLSPRCLEPTATWLAPIGTGRPVMGTIPANVCRLFGPTPATPSAGQPPARPVDPDATGGYYQPLRIHSPATAPSDYITFRTRVDCGIVGLTQAQAAELTQRSHPNENPVLDSVSVGDASLDEATPFPVTAGATIDFATAWAACPTEGTCTGAEQYAVYDPASAMIVTQTEKLQVSWFATAGRFADERTTGTDNAWVAPTTAGAVSLWLVLRDDRGGVSWRSFQLTVSP